MSNLISKARFASNLAAEAERSGMFKKAHDLWNVALMRWNAISNRKNIAWCKARIQHCAKYAGDLDRE